MHNNKTIKARTRGRWKITKKMIKFKNWLQQPRCGAGETIKTAVFTVWQRKLNLCQHLQRTASRLNVNQGHGKKLLHMTRIHDIHSNTLPSKQINFGSEHKKRDVHRREKKNQIYCKLFPKRVLSLKI